MALQSRLDRKTRTAVAIACVLVVALALAPLVDAVITRIHDRSAQVQLPAIDNVEKLPNGSTIVIENDATISRIVEWLVRGAENEQTIEVDDGNFLPGSASLSREGEGRVAELARILKASRDVRALTMFAPNHDDPATLKVQQSRAGRIHDELLKLGVNKEQLAVARDVFEAGENPADEEGLELVLVKKPPDTASLKRAASAG